MGASSTATNNSNSKADVDADADVELFRKWVSHSDMSFHSFDETTATNIRKDLLVWYREHRRKLPWRSDPPPYDGSTAGINNNNNNSTKKKQTAKEKASQSNKKITNFFQANSKTSKNATASSSSSSKAKESTTPKSEDSSTIQLPDPATSLSSSSTANIPIPAAAAAAAVSAYGVWVSEIMLQQTRVEAVIPYWIRWMTSFPTVHALAEATEEQVNAHWAGLGFYRRARLLHQGAKLIVSDYQGEIPGTVEELLKITGIGPYTASAVASIAFDVCVPVVDGNVCRVLSRLTGIANHIKAPALKDKQGWELASQLVHAGDQTCAGEVNQALMELGATYCAPSGTGIDPRDPLKGYYYSTRLAKAYLTIRQNDDGAFLSELSATESQSCACPLCDSSGIRVVLDELEERIQDAMILEDAMKEGHSIFPLDPPKAKRKEEDLAMAVISNVHDGEVWWLLIRRPAKGLLAGQWEFPSVCVEHRQEGQTKPPTPGAAKRRKALTQYLDTGVMTNGEQHWWTTQSTRKPGVPASLEHIFSHVKHIMWLETMTMEEDLSTIQWKTEEGRDVRWMRESDMKEVGITSGVKKVLKAVQSSQLQSKSTTSTKKRKR
jgi:A/G-specific adenine glycosylase